MVQLECQELQKGTEPKEIIRMLHADPDIERRQFGIVDMQCRMAGHSGSANGTISIDVQARSLSTTTFFLNSLTAPVG